MREQINVAGDFVAEPWIAMRATAQAFTVACRAPCLDRSAAMFHAI